MTSEDSGFSSEKLQRAEAYFHKINAAAIFIICCGGVVASWGEVSHRFRCHSIRKSFLSALYGIYAEEGIINLQATLANLDIDDEKPLTEEEKQARVVDMLKSQSGIYLPAAYEQPQQRETRPFRGIHAPGTHYWYNNWGFNALCTIFENEVGIGLFEAFKEKIANPLQMEEFRLIDTNYFWERQYSQHPAYLFRMSAKDLARFGLLYLRNWQWNRQQIIPPRWVAQSTTPYYRWKAMRIRLMLECIRTGIVKRTITQSWDIYLTGSRRSLCRGHARS